MSLPQNLSPISGWFTKSVFLSVRKLFHGRLISNHFFRSNSLLDHSRKPLSHYVPLEHHSRSICPAELIIYNCPFCSQKLRITKYFAQRALSPPPFQPVFEVEKAEKCVKIVWSKVVALFSFWRIGILRQNIGIEVKITDTKSLMLF